MTAFPLPVVVPLDKDVSEVNTVPKSTTPDVGLFVVPFILTPVTVPVFDVFPFQLVMSDEVIPAAALAENTGSVSVVSVPVFLVKPQPDTVDSVTAAGISAIVAALLLLELYAVLNVIASCFPFQVEILEEVIPAAADALNTGSVSVVSVPAFLVNPHPLTVDSVTAVGTVIFFLVVLTERSPEVAVVVPETLST